MEGGDKGSKLYFYIWKVEIKDLNYISPYGRGR